jgi:hypothetical protein
MFIHHMRKSTSGAGGCNSRRCSCGGKIAAKPHLRMVGNGVVPAVFDNSLGVVKPSRVLQNIRIKKANIPKKYISFD